MSTGSQNPNAPRDTLARAKGPLPYLYADFDADTLALLGPAVESAPAIQGAGLTKDADHSSANSGQCWDLTTDDLGSPIGVKPVIRVVVPMLVHVRAHVSLLTTTTFDAPDHLGELDVVGIPAGLTFAEWITGDRKDGAYLVAPGRLAGNAQVELDVDGIVRVNAGDRLMVIVGGAATLLSGTIDYQGFAATSPRLLLDALELGGPIPAIS